MINRRGHHVLRWTRVCYETPLWQFPAGLPRGGRPLRLSAFRRHVINDENADHDADQQRRQKKIFHFDPFALQSRTILATKKFVGVGMRPSLPTWQLTFHGPELINPARAGTVIVRKLEKAGQSPAFSNFWFGPISDGVKLFGRGGDGCGRRAGGLACISGKIRPSRETQCGYAGDDEDDSHLMSP